MKSVATAVVLLLALPAGTGAQQPGRTDAGPVPPSAGSGPTPADSQGLVLGRLPAGYRPLFDRSTLRGWHASGTSHHGTTPAVRNQDGVVSLGQHPYFQGGVLLTDERFRDFDVYLEFLPCRPCDSGLFLRSTEGGTAYQVGLDNMTADARGGALQGEGRPIAFQDRVRAPAPIRQGEWNALRIRMTGGASPRVTVWMNGAMTYDGQSGPSDFWTDVEGGALGFQSHFMGWYTGGRWVPGGLFRFRNVGVKVLS